ncbi:aklanonic acid methyltransferase DauC-like [Oscarella lobularis]|uniref:aklanonic acid methyltransferase DauC-like n=1 Tax=Oscarella lobularis TaxID=121494 RepID=UPI0033134B72
MALAETNETGVHASTYSKLSKHAQLSEGQKFLDRILQPRSGDRVLDFGCGTGNLTLHLAEKIGPKGFLVGVDPDLERIKIAQSRLQSYENIKILHGSIDEAKPFALYDVITSNQVIHWIPRDNHEEYVGKFFDLLRPGGRVGFTTGDDHKGILREISANQYENSYESFIAATGWSLSPLSYWESLFRDAGFEIVYSSKEDNCVVFPDERTLLDWWEATTAGYFSAARRTPEKLLNKYKLKRDEPIPVYASLLDVVAKKPS